MVFIKGCSSCLFAFAPSPLFPTRMTQTKPRVWRLFIDPYHFKGDGDTLPEEEDDDEVVLLILNCPLPVDYSWLSTHWDKGKPRSTPLHCE